MFDLKLKGSIDTEYLKAKENWRPLAEEIDRKIIALNEDRQYMLKFIYAGLPISDVGDYEFEEYLGFAAQSLYVRENMPWGRSVPVRLFLTNVLFPRINNEKIEDHRKQLFDLFFPYIDGITNMEKAVLELNYASLEYGTYRLPSRRTVSPLTFLKRTFGRCGEESTFLVSLLRSFGIPARQIYTPHWPHTDDCHAWVEAWCCGQWLFLGACEPEPVLNKGWFNTASTRSMLLHCRIFDNTIRYPDKVTCEGPVTTIERTSRYAETVRLVVKVVENGILLEGARVEFELINYADFSSLSGIDTDENGECEIELGLGSVWLHISKDGRFMEKLIHTGETNRVEVDFSEAREKDMDGILQFEMHAPKSGGKTTVTVPKELISAHKKRFEQGNEKREKRERNSVVISKDEELNDILFQAKFGGEQVIRFMESVDRYIGLKMLKTLDDKDLADFDEKIIKSHYECAIKYINEFEEEIFVNYILAPRISYEEITDYRPFISAYFDSKTKDKFAATPESVWEYIESEINYLKSYNFDNILSSPKTALTLKEGSPKSKEVLCVAILRSIGVPARLNAETKHPEYYRDGKFYYCSKQYKKTGKLTLKPEQDVAWIYRTNWSLSRLENLRYQGLSIKSAANDIVLKEMIAGIYRLVTVNRLPNGDTVNQKHVFEIKENELTEISMTQRKVDFSNQLIDIELKDFELEQSGTVHSVKELLSDDKNLLLWLGEMEEPTEHILSEIRDAGEFFNELNMNIVFVARNEKALENVHIQQVISAVPKIRACIDRDFFLHDGIARELFTDPGQLPLAVITKNRLNAIYAFSGYYVGIHELILKIIKL